MTLYIYIYILVDNKAAVTTVQIGKSTFSAPASRPICRRKVTAKWAPKYSHTRVSVEVDIAARAVL
ncbi:hypothetical protein GcM1_146016 [Golovinomyces cichoracearum]|uniref:Uncharacterized protein n=1 Tax=Golovinomyces cichoracearum TaxID=62708 RepID=A0A420JBB8_9PEZI|nr:hypothetical protein GcM1_146016 [Golovinomyces cichoracearum]